MGTVLLIVLILLVLGAFGGGYRGWEYGNPVGIVLLVLLIVFLFGRGRLGI